MTSLIILIPVTLGMGIAGLAAFFWSLRSGQYEDLSGDAERILFDEDTPLPPARRPQSLDTPPAAPPAATKENTP